MLHCEPKGCYATSSETLFKRKRERQLPPGPASSPSLSNGHKGARAGKEASGGSSEPLAQEIITPPSSRTADRLIVSRCRSGMAKGR
ncbi:hypothetical protein MRX96_001872 [Rhipicephalus microplus]